MSNTYGLVEDSDKALDGAYELTDTCEMAFLLAFDAAWFARVVVVGVFLLAGLGCFAVGAVRAGKRQTPSESAELDQVAVACFGRLHRFGSTNVPHLLLTISGDEVRVDDQVPFLSRTSRIIKKADPHSFHTRERIFSEVVDAESKLWLGFTSPVRAHQAAHALWFHGWLEEAPAPAP